MAVSASDQSASDLELFGGGQQFDPEVDGRWAEGALHVLQQQADVIPPAGHLTGHRVRVRVRVTGSHDHKVTRQAKSDNGRGHLAGHRVKVTSQLRETEAEVRAGQMTGADGSRKWQISAHCRSDWVEKLR